MAYKITYLIEQKLLSNLFQKLKKIHKPNTLYKDFHANVTYTKGSNSLNSLNC